MIFTWENILKNNINNIMRTLNFYVGMLFLQHVFLINQQLNTFDILVVSVTGHHLCFARFWQEAT
jgi:hypothetical protein